MSTSVLHQFHRFYLVVMSILFSMTVEVFFQDDMHFLIYLTYLSGPIFEGSHGCKSEFVEIFKICTKAKNLSRHTLVYQIIMQDGIRRAGWKFFEN